MIGLRVLHLMTGEGSASAGARNLARWLRGQGHESAIARPLPSGAALGDDEGIEVLAYPSERPSRWLGGRKELKEFAERVVAWKPDLIHVHDLDSLAATLDVVRPSGLPVIAGSHLLADAGTAAPLRDPLVAWVAVPSEVYRAHFISRLGLPRDQVTVLPYGVDLQRVVQAPERRGAAAPVIGAVGAVTETSGHRELIEALARLRADGLPWSALFVGADAGAAALGALAQQHGLSAAVTIEPDGASSAATVDRIDILVHPGEDVSLAVTVIEAMARALPVVAAIGGGITDVVRDGHTGLLVPPRDVPALTVALRTLLADPARASDLGRCGRTAVAERFDLELVGQAAQELYRNALVGSQTSSARAEGTTIFKRIAETRGKG